MGCTDSKLDHLPAISLCRDRCRSLDDALRLSYALEDAHVAYLRSLRDFGGSLNQFVSTRAAPAPGPNLEEVLKQPLHPVSSPRRTSSSSNSGSHVHFNYDSDDDDRRKLGSTSSRLGLVEGYYNPFDSSNPVFDRFASISYARGPPPPYSTYIQPIYDTYPNQGITFGSGAKTTPPPPPPPLPRNSTWDFLNFFEAYGGDEQPSGSSSRRLKVLSSEAEVTTIKHETRIPTSAITTKPAAPATETETGENRDMIPAERSEKSVSIQAEKWKSAESVRVEGGEDLDEVMKEVESLFKKASDSGLAVLRSLDHAKSRYHQQGFCIRQVSSKVLHTIVPFPCHSKPALKTETAPSSSDKDGPNEDVVGSRNFCSTLKKLHMWEKKLYAEVKAEEKLRVIYSRKCKELKQMIEKEKEDDADKIESNGTLIKNLSTQLKISLHIIDAVSDRISKSRDDELWPCLCQLLLGWLKMLKVMEDCHQRQHEAIVESKVRIVTLMDGEQDYGFERLEETMQVKLDLLNLELCFCKWAIAQKTCARALECWLTKCLSGDLEGLLHHPLPSTQTGAPQPVFAVIHQWANALDASRMMPVIGTMSELVGAVGRVYAEGYTMLHAKADAAEDKELERKMKVLEKRDRRLRSELRHAIRRGVIPIPIPITSMEAGAGVRVEGGASDVGPRLEDVLEAMAKYSSYCIETYEELCKFCGDGESSRNGLKFV